MQSTSSNLLALEWPSPPRNVLLVKKEYSDAATESLVTFAKHLQSKYPSVAVLLEPHAALEIHERLQGPVHTRSGDDHDLSPLTEKADLTATFGGDGTILHAASRFAKASTVPPMLSFSMGTLGFLGEWKFGEYHHAFREIYLSGIGSGNDARRLGSTRLENDGPLEERRSAQVLLRSRLKVRIQPATHATRRDEPDSPASSEGIVHAMNEVIIHRGQNPHLVIVEVYVGGRFLTEAIGDGMIISTPTGSTAYSLSSGGSIVHPLVASLLLTPICPRSLSFRPLVLPANAQVTLRLSENNRGGAAEVSIDGCRQEGGVGVGTEVQVCGEDLLREDGSWHGGVPCVVQSGVNAKATGDDGWVGGLNGLLKFNYPFGEDG
ncbi:MAG: NADH kinase pos5 [Phylliscum demangeonii]|nr:MAG: NADH kinase pos5 [Phylliscum demangeonii]